MTSRQIGGSPTVVLVGRPNVGKSTLFNRITGRRRAIVTAKPGTTRDTLTQDTEWLGVTFRIVDSGGVFGASTDPLQAQVVEQGMRAMKAANLVLFVVDGREGCVSADEEVVRKVRPLGVPVVMVVNKTDDRRAKNHCLEFYQFGFEPVIEISAEHGLGIGDLLDEVVKALPQQRGTLASKKTNALTDTKIEEVAVAVIGRPNVGKSSLVNRLLHEPRVMVNAQPGTTRDAIDEVLQWHGKSFRLVDTAGIRRAGRVANAEQVEAVSVLVAKRAIKRSAVALVMLDASEEVADQDATIAGEAARSGCGIVIVANKWDLRKSTDPLTAKTFDESVRRKLRFLDFAPILHISALTGERLSKVLETVDRIASARSQRVPTAAVNHFVEKVTRAHSPPSSGRKVVRILYASQIGIEPPSFVFFTNVATKFHFSYERFLINQLRETFGFEGSPIKIHVRRRQK